MSVVTYGSVCSGIEAATTAWHPLGMIPTWFAEIEPFPSAVLAHRFPTVHNLGDMTTIAEKVRCGVVHAPTVLVGGTPCQAFSVAGLRGGLTDPRGELTIKYVELLNELDSARAVRGKQPTVAVWENVPGVLSSKDNAFGCFLAALAGENDELVPAGGKWTDAGCVYGPQRAVAWRVLDAQYFGLAQRRRRVFVIASARAGFDPAAVLFECEGVRRDTPPSRQSGQDVTGTISSRTTGGGGLGTDFECAGGLQPVGFRMVAFGEYSDDGTASTMKARDYKDATDLAVLSVALRGRDGGATAVRRLTPTECERLQGFPDGWTAIPWRNKPESECPDGPRYKAIGNSKAVPVVRWIGERLLSIMAMFKNELGLPNG